MMCGSYPTIKALRAKAKPVLPRILARMEGKGIDSNAILFFPDLPAKKGFICHYTKKEGHGECSLEYYKKSTKAPKSEGDCFECDSMVEHYNQNNGAHRRMKRLSRKGYHQLMLGFNA